jgi:hypothetical protein
MKKHFSSTVLISLSALMLMIFSSLPTLFASTVGALVPVEIGFAPQERPDVAYDALNNRYRLQEKDVRSTAFRRQG